MVAAGRGSEEHMLHACGASESAAAGCSDVNVQNARLLGPHLTRCNTNFSAAIWTIRCVFQGAQYGTKGGGSDVQEAVWAVLGGAVAAVTAAAEVSA